MQQRCWFCVLMLLLGISPSIFVQATQGATWQWQYSFETGVEGWSSIPEANTSLTVEQADTLATEGTKSLNLSGTFDGSEGQIAGVSVIYSEPMDWSNVELARLDVFAPSSAYGLTIQIFLKTDNALTFESFSFTLTPGSWTEVATGLWTDIDLSNVREFGVKISGESTFYDGSLYLDNIILYPRTMGSASFVAGGAATLAFYEVAQRVMNRVGSQPTDSSTNYSFAQNLENWELESIWAAGKALAWTEGIPNWTNAQGLLQLATTFTPNSWQEAGVVRHFRRAVRWSRYRYLSIEIYVPEHATALLGQLFIRSGTELNWHASSFVPIVSGQWTTLIFALEASQAVSEVHDVGLKVGSEQSDYTGYIYIDNVRLSLEKEAPRRIDPPSSIRAITKISPVKTVISQFEKFESVISLDAEFLNPYDPSQIRVEATFLGPSGQSLLVPGFYFRDFDYHLFKGTERMEATENWSWRVRFTPSEIGTWHYQLTVITQSATAYSEIQTFQVIASRQHGFVTVDPRNTNYFVFADGTPYFPIGLNMAWYGSGKTADYRSWLDAFSTAGGNFVRLWMAPWAFDIEWSDTGLGTYSNRQDRAYQLDKVIEMIEARGMTFMLTLLNHGKFSLDHNSEWADNPLNSANGGPLDSPEAFTTNTAAQRLWIQKLRYIAARWGYSQALVALEWWNEVNLTPLSDAKSLVPWIALSTAYMRVFAPYPRLFSISGLSVQDISVWSHPSISFTQLHLYDVPDVPSTFHEVISDWLQRFPEKPFLLAEFGSPQDYDKNGLLLHLGLWSAAMNGAAGSGMFWWWNTYIEPMNLYYRFKGIGAFFEAEDMANRQWHDPTAKVSGDISIFGRQSEDKALLWIIKNNYLNDIDKCDEPSLDVLANFGLFCDAASTTKARLTLQNLKNGDYLVEWWDTKSGTVLVRSQLTAIRGTITLDVPPVLVDIALKVKASGPSNVMGLTQAISR